MRTGEVEWLDELGFPGALRTLHTQIMQCSPTERWFYCGQAPTGYGAYRTDFNSSHAYFENLFLYYWLTGDQTVLDIVQRGADSMRRYDVPDARPEPSVDAARPRRPGLRRGLPGQHPGHSLTGRVAQQWHAVFRFMGLASNDASFLEDYRLSFARADHPAVRGARAERPALRLSGREDVTGPGGPTRPDRPGPSASTTPRTSTGCSGTPATRRSASPLPPSRVLAALARTVAVLGPGAEKGKAADPDAPWPRVLAVTWTGPRIGGTFTSVEPKDRELYNPEKFGTVALLVRGGRQSGHPELIRAGDEMIRSILRRNEDVLPLCKIQGQTLTRLHAAVALAAASAPR